MDLCAAHEEELCMYAVVPSADGALFSPGRWGAVLPVGPIAALIGPAAPYGDIERRALAHDRVVLRALAACSSVVPFRLGVNVPGRGALVRVLERNRDTLTALLRRFAGKVEMGIKIRLPDDGALGPPSSRVSRELAGVHRLTADSEDRREHIRRDSSGVFFEGTYLIPRGKIESFWARTEAVRAKNRSLPMLTSGPFAPYSFCGWLHREDVA